MTIARAAAWLLFAVSIAIATLADDMLPTGPPRSADSYRVVTADLHVHAFLGDGALAPWDIRREARRRGLDAVAITNHNQMYAARLDRALFPGAKTPLTLMAEELTAPAYHLIVLGIREPIDWRLPLADAIRAVHARGGVAIAAHPSGMSGKRIDDEVLGLLDGLELAHPVSDDDPSARADLDALYARATRIKPTIAAIGASDFHFGAPLGSWRTLLLVGQLTEEGVLDAIRGGRTVAYDHAGNAYGHPAWISAVAAAATGPGAATPLPDSRRHAVSAIVAWLSLLFLVIFGAHHHHPRTCGETQMPPPAASVAEGRRGRV
jgi:predicted metal-dependent phosphoesterase TrpH